MTPPSPFGSDGYGADRPSGPSVTAAYDRLGAAGEIEPDRSQRAIAGRLDRVLLDLGEERLAAKGSALGWLFGRKKPVAAGPRGLYVWGGVGRGKTMLMDLFFDLAPIRRKRRQHFHVFMAEVHERIFEARRQLAAGADRDPVEMVADALSDDLHLLCFDEFVVTDIADAMILGRLFGKLFERGIVLVATSNVPPDGLYKDGINRDHVLPFIALLERRCEVAELQSPTDYRLRELGRAEVYVTPAGREADAALDRLWLRLTGVERGPSRDLSLKGRSVHVPQACGRVARFGYPDLCVKPLGPADFQAIAAAFDTVIVDRVPALDHERRNEARRFITLVDTLYDEGVKLALSAAAPPAGLYRAASGAEAFEFDRTASRLIEMGTEAYLGAPRREPGGTRAARAV